uniref:Uncharacterized protein n=1 Tax=Amphimedon queenslandica TaxID=400682 RepID=A0A1X7T0M1_AMPQE
MNSTLEELNIQLYGSGSDFGEIVSIIKGVTRNDTITSLFLSYVIEDENYRYRNDYPNLGIDLPNEVLEQLLKNNKTLNAFCLIKKCSMENISLNIVNLNAPQTAIDIRDDAHVTKNSELMGSLLSHIKELHSLRLHRPYSTYRIFISHPSLHTLSLPLNTAESAIELFTILQTNTTLKALRVTIDENTISVGTSLQDLLKENQTLNIFEVTTSLLSPITPILPFLTTGLCHNNGQQQLRVPITLPVISDELIPFLYILSQNKNLTEIQFELKLHFRFMLIRKTDELDNMLIPLFYTQVLPAVTNMLQSHTTIKQLRILCFDLVEEYIPADFNNLDKEEYAGVMEFLKTIYTHPSLEHVLVGSLITFRKGTWDYGFYNRSILKDIFKDQKQTLIDRHKKEQPHKPLPEVIITLT